MFGRTFYHETLRKYVILFGTIFNDVWINRTDENGNVKQALKVPLSYGPREKFLARIEGIANNVDPVTQQVATVLPRMSFEMQTFNYAADRKLSSRKIFATSNGVEGDRQRFHFNPVPYDINFSLSIYVKNTTDGTRIVEQILPYFTPDWTSTVQLLDDPDVTLDIPIVINDISSEDVYEGSFEERRALIWTVNFTMKAYLFGPVKTTEVIKLANVAVYDSTIFTDIDDSINNIADEAATIDVSPGLLANGNPTTYNSTNVIQATAIAYITDDYVSEILVTDSGIGYADGTTVTIAPPDSGTTATATAIVENDSVTGFIITDPGSGYLSAPTVTISSPDLVSVATTEIQENENFGIVNVIGDPYP